MSPLRPTYFEVLRPEAGKFSELRGYTSKEIRSKSPTRTSKLGFVLLVAAFLSGCRQSSEVRQIQILSEAGPWPEQASSLVVTRNPGAYSANGREIPRALVADLRLAILATPIGKLDPEKLGITPLWAHHVGRQALVAFEKEHPIQLSARDEDAFIASFNNEKLIQEAVETALLAHTDDRPAIQVEVRLEDGEEISLSSRSQYAFMLPWAIKVRGKSAVTYDPHIAVALRKLLPAGFTNSERLSDKKLKLDVAYFVMRHNEHLAKYQ